MPFVDMVILGIVVASMVAFCAVAGWVTLESGKQRKNEEHQAAAK